MKPGFSAPHVLGATSILTISVFLTLAAIAFPQPLAAQQCELTIGAPACSSQTDAGSSSPAYLPKSYVGNPVDVVTGNKYQHADDYLAFGSRLQFSRHYNSADHTKSNTLGHGWRHSFDVKLKRASKSRLLIKQSDGRIVEFIADSANSNTYKARHDSDGYVEMSKLSRWVLPTGKALSFKGSYLVEIAFDDGKALKLFYKDKKLSTVTDHFGRKITLSYYQPKKTLGSYGEKHDGSNPGSLQSVELPDGSLVRYQYDKRKNLVTVSYPEGTQSQYQYTDPDYHHHLTGANEAIESNQKHWEYDQYGRATKYTNQRAELAMDIDYIPKTDENKQHRTRVKTNEGWSADYAWQHSNQLKLPVVTEYKEKACTDCAPTQQQFTHESVVNWAPEEKVADKPVSDDNETHTLDASQGSLGAEVSMGEDQYQVSVDRLGKVRDVSDGKTSLSAAARSLFDPQSSGESIDVAAVDKLLEVKDRVVTNRAYPSIERPAGDEVCWNEAEPHINPERSCDDLQHDYEMAELANCVYEDGPCGNGYAVVDPDRLGLDSDLFVYEGFKATLYESSEGELVLAFRGSRATSLGDWINNYSQNAGDGSRYYEHAKELAGTLDQAGIDFEVTGHSLGGGLASAASLDRNLEAVIFNSAWVHPNTVDDYWEKVETAEQNIMSYTVDGDFLSSMQDSASPDLIDAQGEPVIGSKEAPGDRFVLERPESDWIDDQQTFNLPPQNIVLHSMDAILKTLGDLVSKTCGIGLE